MISCPLCSRPTTVVETRATGNGGGARRRRKCTDTSCPGRVTTVEVVVERVGGADDLANGHAVIVSRRTISKLQRLISALGGSTS